MIKSRFEARVDFARGRVYLQDIRNSNVMCCPDVIQWLEAHGVPWETFKRDGVAFEVLEQSGDALALKAIEVAKQREAGQ